MIEDLVLALLKIGDLNIKMLADQNYLVVFDGGDYEISSVGITLLSCLQRVDREINLLVMKECS
jgi:hypothetical protein